MEQAFLKGADISILKEVEDFGGKFYSDGKETDLLEILRIKGINTIRIRLWVHPFDDQENPYLGGTNDLKAVIELAKRAKAHGMKFMLNLHYSDFWADPKKQSKPKSWKSLTGQQLEDKVYQYTQEVIKACEENDVVPEFIQIGNEITNGMLWPDGKTPTYLVDKKQFEEMDPTLEKKSYDQLARLLNAGINATKDSRLAHSSKIILHLDQGGANELYRKWFAEMVKRKVDFDVIGLSYYPFWHGSLQDLQDNMDDISQHFNKEVFVVETAYGFTDEAPSGGNIFSAELAREAGYPPTVQGQQDFLRDLMNTVRQVPNQKGIGIVYWEPAWLPVKNTSWASYEGMDYGNDHAATGNPWANQGLFDFQGKALDSLNVFGEF